MSSNNKINDKIAEIKDVNPIKFEVSTKSKKQQKQDEIYHLINADNIRKKVSLKTKICVSCELSFLILTFILVFRKAMVYLLKKNTKEIEELPMTPKKKQIFKSSSESLNICICTYIKNQNLYINEFIQFYQNIGVNKFFLYDNNDENGETFNDLVKEYIDNNTVEIIDWRGKNNENEKMLDDCYKKNYNNYDWLIFYSLDEYIHIKDNNDIKAFLSDKIFDNCECIYLNWLYHTDNNQLKYDCNTLQSRFPLTESITFNNNTYIKHFVKPIMKGHGIIIDINNIYKLSDNLNGCDGSGNKVIFNGNEININDFENNYIDYYWCKSTEEFINKIINITNVEIKNENIYQYFSLNEINEEKINYIENTTNINLSEFRLSLNVLKTDK